MVFTRIGTKVPMPLVCGGSPKRSKRLETLCHAWSYILKAMSKVVSSSYQNTRLVSIFKGDVIFSLLSSLLLNLILRTHGLVEIIWRGRSDFHCTLQSDSEDGFVRVGTSCQISKSVANSSRKLHERAEGDRASRVVGMNERVAVSHSSITVVINC